MTEKQLLKTHFGKLSPELVTKLKAFAPAEREQAIAMAAQLLAKKAQRSKG